jgi:hypothetical protein
MSIPKAVAAPAALTPEQTLRALLEITGDLDAARILQQRLPAGLLKASSSTLAALDTSARALHASQAKVASDLQRLRPLKTFCIDELSRALRARWPAQFDVEHDHLELPGADCGCTPGTPGKGAAPSVAPATRTLLEAAMQNFSADETTLDGFPAGSVIRVASTPSGVPGLTPPAFARFCRELDLGQRYQAHFLQVFGLRDAAGTVVTSSAMTADIATMKRQLLQLDLHLALVKGHVTPAGFQTVQRLIDARGVVSRTTLHYQGRPWIMQGIEVLDSCVWGAVVFCARSVEQYPDEPCLVYMAGEPDQPLYEYPRFSAFVKYLSFKLGLVSYRRYFIHCIDESDKADFLEALARQPNLGQVKPLSISAPLFDFMLKSHVGKCQLDARALAVPTADVDEEVRKQRLLNYLQIGMTVANVAGLFVPVLGELMMGVAVGQLLGEVYEGVEDWQRGDRQEALTHLLSVAENIALMAATGVGQNVLKSLALKTVRQHPEFFRPFTAVLNRQGQERLWKPELEAYAQQFPSGVAVTPDAAGLYHLEGKTWVRIDDRLYAVTLDPVTRRWHIQHPSRAQAYAPPLEHNGQGGWRHHAEPSEQWTGAYTLKRIDPRLADLDESRLEMVRRLTDTRFDQLHRLSDDNRPLTPRLRDALGRLRIERRLRDLVSGLAQDEFDSRGSVEELLHTLPNLPRWPQDRYIKVLDAQGRISATYPPTTIDDDTLSVIIRQAQLDRGELLQAVIDGLYPREVNTLLGVDAAPKDEAALLAKTIASTLKVDRRALFEHLYQRYDQSALEEVRKVRAVDPQLPARYAHELLRQAPSVERLQLRATDRVPLALAQRAREAGAAVRLDRALSGLYLGVIANADSERLAIRLLPRLPGWDSKWHLQMREQSLKGTLLESIGVPSAKPCTVVRLKSGHAAYGSDGQSVGRVEAGPDSLYKALLKVLPAPQREALGFDAQADESWRLRQRLLNCALDEREGCARVLAGGALDAPVRDLPCLQADPPDAQAKHSRSLLAKVRKLYPGFSAADATGFLDGLGTDALSRATRVKQLQLDLQRLRAALQDWAADEAGIKAVGGVLSDVRDSRQATAFLIEDSFRRMLVVPDQWRRPVYALNLDGMRVGKLPTLPVGVSFDHIQRLSLKNMQQGNDVAYFLKAFRQIESLELDRNQLTLLPEVISHMPGLRQLSLAGNRLKLTEQTLVKLANLRTLHVLNLSDNHLGATPDVSKMGELVHLALRNTRATELPKGIERLPDLDLVDMRGNDIQELPQWLFRMERRFSETLNLRGNPLSTASSTRLEDYRDRVGVGMGFVENDSARLDEGVARSLWLTETGGQVGERRLGIWTALKDDPRSEGLFHLLAELGNTADSEHVREELTRRVWAVLEHTEVDTPLREQVFDLAANPMNCTDSAALNFSHVELAVLIHQVTEAQPASTQTLLDLGRGLFRLEQLDRIAAEHAARHPTLDPLEVSLAYRTGLAEPLELPGQPRHMRYAALGGVTPADLEVATHRVKAAELSSAWHRFLVDQPFWKEHLRRQFPQEFAVARGRYQALIQTLFEQADDYSSAEYLRRMNAYAAEQAQAEHGVVEKMTGQVQRLVDLGLCVLPDHG